MTKERLRRTDPPRSEPIRDWEQLFRQPEPDSPQKDEATDGAEAAEKNGANDHAWDDVVTHAVKLGYQIIEDQISQGKRVAEQVSDRSYTSNSIGGDVSEFVRRLLQFYTDIGATCFDFIDALTRSTEFTDNVRGWVDEGLTNSSGKEPDLATEAASYQNVPIEVVSEQPARVSLDLAGIARNCRLGVHGLYALDPSNPPLRDIEFNYGVAEHQPTLRIRIPQGQPADTYTGAIIDADTNQPRGTLSVVIRQGVPGTS